MKYYPPTGEQLGAYMVEHHLTSREVSAMLRMSNSDGRTVRHWVAGRKLMPFAQWYALRCLVDGHMPAWVEMTGAGQLP